MLYNLHTVYAEIYVMYAEMTESINTDLKAAPEQISQANLRIKQNHVGSKSTYGLAQIIYIGFIAVYRHLPASVSRSVTHAIGFISEIFY